MADLSKLEAPKDWEFVEHDELGPGVHLEWLRDVVRHVEAVLGPWLDELEAVALSRILANYCLEFWDGFAVGAGSEVGVEGFGMYIDSRAANLVASTFVPGVTYFDMRDHRFTKVDHRYDAMLARLESSQKVWEVDKDHPPKIGTAWHSE